MTSPSVGNAQKDGLPFGGWFVGDLLKWSEVKHLPNPAPDSVRQASAVEAKWFTHPRGQTRPGGWTAPGTKRTLSILVKGRFAIRFEKGAPREVVLVQEGDYVAWSEEIPHTWEAIDDSTVLTVRWFEDNA